MGVDQGRGRTLGGMVSRLVWVLAVNFIFLLVEVAGGLLANSLALLADAGHMLTDVAALALALAAALLARRPPTPRRTFGLLRTEVLGAFTNGALLVLMVGFIFWEAWQRLHESQSVQVPILLAVGTVGLAVNAASAWILAGGARESLNVRGAFLHMVGDALGSVGAIGAGLVIWWTGWTPVDALASLFIGLLILWSSWGLLRQTMNILLEATPENIDFEEVKRTLEELEHVTEVHDLHIWTIASGIPILSAHLRLENSCSDSTHWQHCLREAQALLRKRFGIVHSTLQMEPPHFVGDDRPV
jgi:cobalt-zinc-cadmium efflux system protein